MRERASWPGKTQPFTIQLFTESLKTPDSKTGGQGANQEGPALSRVTEGLNYSRVSQTGGSNGAEQRPEANWGTDHRVGRGFQGDPAASSSRLVGPGTAVKDRGGEARAGKREAAEATAHILYSLMNGLTLGGPRDPFMGSPRSKIFS